MTENFLSVTIKNICHFITFIVYTSRNFTVSLIFKVRDSEYHILNDNDNMIQHPEDKSLLLIFKMFPKVLKTYSFQILSIERITPVVEYEPGNREEALYNSV